MRSLTAIALIACLVMSHAQTVTVTPYDSFEKCTGTTLAASSSTVNKFGAVTTSVTSDTCTQIGTTGKYFKVVGTSAGVTAFQTYGSDTTCGTGTNVLAASVTLPLTPGTTKHPLLTTNSDVAASGAPHAVLTISGTTMTIDAYDDATNPSAGTTVNKLHAAPDMTTTSGTCTQIGTTGKYIKAVFTTSITEFKSYPDNTCGAGTQALNTAISGTAAYGTCLALKTDSADVTTTGASNAPYVRLYWDSAASKVQIRAYDTTAACTSATTLTASTAATANKLVDIATTPLTTGTCTKIGTSGTNYIKAVFTTAPALTSLQSFGTDTTCATANAKEVAAVAADLAFDKCIAQKTDNTDVTPTSTTPYFKVHYNAPASAKNSAMNMSVGIAALFALLIAALF